ncbi:MAG: hypothetical protein ABI613_08840 [Gemmatimonadota bacterium]
MTHSLTGRDTPQAVLVLLAVFLVSCGGEHTMATENTAASGRALPDSVVDVNTRPLAATNPALAWFDTAGHRTARQIEPIDIAGHASSAGKIVFLSIGMSNADQEFCGASSADQCNPWTFEALVKADRTKNPALVLVNGAASGQMANTWITPAAANYDHVKARLAAVGLTEKQVQVIWLKVANGNPTIALPSPNADAYELERNLGDIVRSVRLRYPSLRQIYVSSRSYAGYANVPLNPEPYAFQSGFSVGWLVLAQVHQMSNGTVDPVAGDLSAPLTAPWISWGPYLWANGSNPRGDGLTWLPSDFEADGTHPSPSGEAKVGQLLFNYFRTSPYASCWYFGQKC